MRIWPSVCVCQAVRAPGSNVTRKPDARAGAIAWNRGSTRTEPVKFSAGARRDGCEPLRIILIAPSSLGFWLCAPDTNIKSETPIAVKIRIAALLDLPLPVAGSIAHLRNRRASPIRSPTASRQAALSRDPEPRWPSHPDGNRRSNPCSDRNASKPASPRHSDRRSWRS